MTNASGDTLYRGFTLSSVRQGGEWLVSIWPKQVEQELPSPGETPVMAATQDEALALARQEIDRLLGPSNEYRTSAFRTASRAEVAELSVR